MGAILFMAQSDHRPMLRYPSLRGVPGLGMFRLMPIVWIRLTMWWF
jgi:hypothetical protein